MGTPHPIPYQGSKRALAGRILSYMPRGERLFEPFVGSAAITLAAAARDAYAQFVIGDALRPLVEIWRLLLTDPQHLCRAYEQLWRSQLGDPRGAYDRIRRDFNRTQQPTRLLYLLTRCVKASVRFNSDGEFNQSPDNRRLGMRPSVMRRQVMAAHALLTGRTEALVADFRQTLSAATPADTVYLDPPYQGISQGRDRRYYQGVLLDELVDELARLNGAGIPFVLSYDGSCGERRYGRDLPDELGLTKVALQAGRSSQSTLVGRAEITVESLYVSPAARLAIPASEALARAGRQMAGLYR